MQIKYRFSINGTSVNPIYKDDLSKEYELEPQERFYRASLSGKLVFVKDDFTWLDNQTFSTEFELLIEKSNDGGLTWNDYYTGVFYKTDGKWDEDNKRVEVKVETLDEYTEVLAGLDKEFNLIKLAPAKTFLQIKKRPLIQVYIPGDSVVSCFLGGNYWEQDVAFEVTDISALVNTYYFALASTIYRIYVSGSGTPSEIVGDYVGESGTTFRGRNILGLSEETYRIARESGTAYSIIDLHDKTSSDLGSIWQDSNTNQWKLVEITDTTHLLFFPYGHSSAMPSASDSLTHVSGATNTSTINYSGDGGTSSMSDYKLYRDSDDALMFFSKIAYSSLVEGTINFIAVTGTGTFTGTIIFIKCYMRYLLDVEVISGLNTYTLPSDDIVENNRNYSRAIGYAIDQISVSYFANVDPTEYGLMDDGYYFEEPPGFPTYYKYFPVSKSQWGFFSLWFNFDLFDSILEEQGRKNYLMKDSMLISDVISVLVTELDPTIDHDGTSTYSEFLYGTSNPLTLGQFRVMLTQKSNILAGEYDRPAQKAPITLGKILDMLKYCFQCYWYIDDSKLKIEHISWFKNGGAYTGSPLLTADLTTLVNPKNQKLWGLYSSNYDYDKFDLSEQIEFSWMDDVTVGFEGYPIKINSKFVQRGKVDTINAGDFTSDIDYMLLNPSAINPDGFALMAAIENPELDYILRETEYYYNSSGVKTSASIWDYQKYLVEPNTKYLATGCAVTVAPLILYFDKDDNFISADFSGIGPPYVIYTDEEITTPSNAYYAIVNTVYDNPIDLKYGGYVLPFIQRTIDDADLTLQNGLVSWIYLHPNFWVHDLPSDDVEMNNGEGFVSVQGVQRKKKQNVRYPSLEDPEPLKLIKTDLGNGQIEKISVNLSSRMNEIQLKYDTE